MIAGDITRLKQTEERLHESEQRYYSLIDDILDRSKVGIFILDKSFKVVWVNVALERYFGLGREKVMGKDHRQLIDGPMKDIFEEPATFAEKVLATYDNNTYTERFDCHVLAGRQREDRWLEHWSQPIHSGLFAGGRIEQYTDITHRKRTEAEIAAAQKKLIDAVSTAEAATKTLCNVGNLLKSINVSANAIRDTVLNARTTNLKKIIDLIAAHADNLGTFLTEDERGKHVLTYLTEAAALTLDEQADITDKLRLLTQNLEHVRQIIQTQLGGARTDGAEALNRINTTT